MGLYLYLIFFYLSVVPHSPVFLDSSVYEIIILNIIVAVGLVGGLGPLVDGPY